MEPRGVIYFAYCATNPALEKDDQKWEAISKLYPNAAILNPSKTNGSSNLIERIFGCDIVIASEIDGQITADVHDEISEAFSHQIPVYVIRETGNSFSFYEVLDLESIEDDNGVFRYAKIIVKDPDGLGKSVIDRNLLINPFEV